MTHQLNSIKKVLLLTPSFTVDKTSIRRLVNPINFLYIGAVLEQNGYEVVIVDSPCEGYDNISEEGEYVTYGLSPEQLKERINFEKPDVIGVACSFSFNEEKVNKLCTLIKSLDTNIITIVGGIHPSFFPKEMMEECSDIDFIVLNEGEYRALNLLNALKNGKSYDEIEGIAFRKNNEIKINPAKGFIQDLDKIPFPARHLVNMEKYFEIGMHANPFVRNRRVARVLTSRGCPFNCCFCPGTSYWGRFRPRSVENIIEEMRILKEKYHAGELHFLDDNLTLDRKRAMELFKRMKEEKFGFKWCTPGGIMMKTLDEELIKAMAESGCYQLTFSPETGSQRVLDQIIHKHFDLKIVKPLVEICHKHDIDVHSNFIVGLPGETREELMMTFNFAKEVDFDSVAFFIAVPVVGTELYNICKTRGWLKNTSRTADFKHANIFIGEHEKEFVMPREELEKLVETKTREFNEWSKQKDPERWNRKFKIYNETKKDLSDKIMGRVV